MSVRSWRGQRWIIWLAALVMVAVLVGAWQSHRPVQASSVMRRDKAVAPTADLSKLQGVLVDWVRHVQTGDDPALVAERLALPLRSNSVFVYVYADPARLEEIDPAAVTATGAQFNGLQHNILFVTTSASALIRLAQLPWVQTIDLPAAAVSTAITTAGLDRLNLAEYHAFATPYRGQGIKIAVIDIGYKGLQARLAAQELPAGVHTVLCTDGTACQADANIETGSTEVHGVACAEIIHDLAPDAELYLIRIQGEAPLQHVVDYLKQAGIRLASVSLEWEPNEGPLNGHDRKGVNSAVTDAANNGILMVFSAGNRAQNHFQGAFRDANGDLLHEFKPGNFFRSTDQTLNFVVGAGMTATVFLAWDEWNLADPTQSAASSNYDLEILQNGKLILESTDVQDGELAKDFPKETLNVVNTSTTRQTYEIQVVKHSGADRTIRLDIWNGGFTEYASAAQSISIPGDSPAALTVGAVNVSDDVLEPYSSQGPTGDGSPKPDLASFANVNTASYPRTYWGNEARGDGSRGFNGTSAATPHVVGAAAVLWSMNPNLDATSLRGLLMASTVDRGSLGPDNQYGAGVLRLAALGAPGLQIVSPTTLHPSLAGPKDAPYKIAVEVAVRSAGGAFLGGLDSTHFIVRAGGIDATVVSAVQLNGRYILDVQLPTQTSDGAVDLAVTAQMGNQTASSTAAGALLYTSTGVLSTDTVLVLDRSGSMSGTPLTNAQQSANLFVDLLRDLDQIGVGSFSSSATLNMPLAVLQTGSPTARVQAHTAINGLVASGNTSIGGGLNVAYQELVAHGDPNHHWVIVLLSDGLENTAPMVGTVLPNIVNSRAAVYTIGLGSVDAQLMQSIASQTGGRYFFTPNSTELTSLYNTISGQVAQRQVLANVTGAVGQGQSASHSVTVDSTMHQVVFAVSWNTSASRLSLTLRSPSGETLQPGAAQPANVQFVGGQTYQTYTITSPDVGQWLATVKGTAAQATSLDISQEALAVTGEAYNLQVQGDTSLQGQLYTDRREYPAGEPVLIQSLLGDVALAPDLTALAQITNPAGVTTILPLGDDGQFGDVAAGDAILSRRYTDTDATGTYRITLRLRGRTAANEPVERVLTDSIVVVAATDGDGDGLPLAWEERYGTNTVLNDRTADDDLDGLTNLQEFQNGTHPQIGDTDGDGLLDAAEVLTYKTSPISTDSDGGGRPDGEEVATGLNPLVATDDFATLHLPLIRR